MSDILKVFERARRVDVYLAWQKISDGRLQIRRYSPNATNSELKLFEPASKEALKWLEQNNNPSYESIDKLNPTGKSPYDVFYLGAGSCNRV